MITVTDLFAGAGGSSTGMIQVPGVAVTMAANHWQLACDIHNANHPETDHAAVDLHEEDPRFFPRTDVLWASPECTKWSQAGAGASRPAIEEGLFEDPNSDAAATRSRLLMFDVLRFAEHHRYRAMIIENVVDIAVSARYRLAWDVWRRELRGLGYQFRVVSLNSMHAQSGGLPAPQSRDRLYIACWREGGRPIDIEPAIRPRAFCVRCGEYVEARQSWKNGRTVGKYRAQYVYVCGRDGQVVEPYWLPAAAAIDWSLAGNRIGDRLSPKTRARIAAGIARYWGPVHLEESGNQYDAADPKHPRYGHPDAYYRAWSTDDVLRTLHTSATKALAVPVEGRDGKAAQPMLAPFRTQTTRHETAMVTPFIAELRGGGSDARSVEHPAATFTASGNHHGLVTSAGGTWNDSAWTASQYLPTLTTRDAYALVTPYYSGSREAQPVVRPIGTLTTVDRYALIHRHNTGGAEMTTPVIEELRTLTTAGHQSLIQHRERPTVEDLRAAEEMVPECLFRMLTPQEVAAGMGFPADYDWHPGGQRTSNRNLTKAAGNAVTPCAARDLMDRVVEALS